MVQTKLLEVLQMLDAQVPVCVLIGLKCWKFCCWKSCANTLYAIPSFLQTSWLHRYLCAFLSVMFKCWKFCWECCDNTLYASTIFPCSLQTSWLPRYLCACLSVVLKCWKFCWESCANKVYARTIFPSDKLVAQVLGVRIDWF